MAPSSRRTPSPARTIGTLDRPVKYATESPRTRGSPPSPLPMRTTITASSAAERSHGTAASALRNPNFRLLWLGLFASNIGTWMQNLVLPAYIDARTESALWVGLFVFAQLGPLLLLSIPGGVLADKFPR